MRFEYYKTSDGWRWRLRGANGEVVATGESYTKKADCLRAIERVKAGALDSSIKQVNHKQIGNIVAHDIDDPRDVH